MAANVEMSVGERRKYLKLMAKRYAGADRDERGRLLTEMEAVTGMHRKSLGRLLNGESLERRARRVQRGGAYGAEVADVIRVVWESEDYLCAERLTPSLLPMAQHLARFGELQLSSRIERQLTQISEATVQRLLGRFRQDTPRLPRRGPESANRLAREIPMGRIPWQTKEPGHFEMDLVHHCGRRVRGTTSTRCRWWTWLLVGVSGLGSLAAPIGPWWREVRGSWGGCPSPYWSCTLTMEASS